MKPLSDERLLLLKAADLIERHGWIQGSYGTGKRGYCAMGAIMADMRSFADFPLDAVGLMKEYLGTGKSVPAWNDNPDRTKQEVVSALRAAAVHGL